MRFNAAMDYALQFIVYLTMKGTKCSARDVANDLSISRDFLAQISHRISKKRIVKGIQGRNGGYVLAKDPADITLLQIFSAFDKRSKKKKRIKPRKQKPEVQEAKKACQLVEKSIDVYLESLTIEMLLQCVQNPSQSHEYLIQNLQREARMLQEKTSS